MPHIVFNLTSNVFKISPSYCNITCNHALYYPYPSGIDSFSFMLSSTEVPTLLFRRWFAYFGRIIFDYNCTPVDSQHSVPSAPVTSNIMVNLLNRAPLLRSVANTAPPSFHTFPGTYLEIIIIGRPRLRRTACDELSQHTR